MFTIKPFVRPCIYISTYTNIYVHIQVWYDIYFSVYGTVVTCFESICHCSFYFLHTWLILRVWRVFYTHLFMVLKRNITICYKRSLATSHFTLERAFLYWVKIHPSLYYSCDRPRWCRILRCFKCCRSNPLLMQAWKQNSKWTTLC